MHLYLGTSLPEIVKLEQVQRVAANAIKSWSELGGEVERAEPARLAKLGGRPELPTSIPGAQAPGRGRSHLSGTWTAKEAEKIIRNW